PSDMISSYLLIFGLCSKLLRNLAYLLGYDKIINQNSARTHPATHYHRHYLLHHYIAATRTAFSIPTEGGVVP
ncbi:MAG: hypothetical protein LBP24_00455, partial [Coriobacteriales bacterium]|nr:hypothetical protein [Coriobacteriales bacterium]